MYSAKFKCMAIIQDLWSQLNAMYADKFKCMAIIQDLWSLLDGDPRYKILCSRSCMLILAIRYYVAVVVCC